MTFARERFDHEGYFILKGALERDCLVQVQRESEVLVEEVAARLVAEGRVQQAFAEAPFTTRLMRLFGELPDQTPTTFRQELHRPGFYGLFAHPELLAVAEQVLGLLRSQAHPEQVVRDAQHWAQLKFQ